MTTAKASLLLLVVAVVATSLAAAQANIPGPFGAETGRERKPVQVPGGKTSRASPRGGPPQPQAPPPPPPPAGETEVQRLLRENKDVQARWQDQQAKGAAVNLPRQPPGAEMPPREANQLARGETQSPKKDCGCSTEVAPVCAKRAPRGSNAELKVAGVTMVNECEAKCQGYNHFTPGTCNGTPKSYQCSMQCHVDAADANKDFQGTPEALQTKMGKEVVCVVGHQFPNACVASCIFQFDIAKPLPAEVIKKGLCHEQMRKSYDCANECPDLDHIEDDNHVALAQATHDTQVCVKGEQYRSECVAKCVFAHDYETELLADDIRQGHCSEAYRPSYECVLSCPRFTVDHKLDSKTTAALFAKDAEKKLVCVHGQQYPSECVGRCVIEYDVKDPNPITAGDVKKGQCSNPCAEDVCSTIDQATGRPSGRACEPVIGSCFEEPCDAASTYTCINRDCRCKPVEWSPVCANGVTYHSICFAECSGADFTKLSEGECERTNPYYPRPVPYGPEGPPRPQAPRHSEL